MKKNIQNLMLLSFSLFGYFVFGQARLVINNSSYMVIDNGAKIVIDNPNDNAISTLGSVKGIVSESENDEVIWKIGSSTGNYIIPWVTNPFGTSTSIPLTVQITGAGNLGGQLELATYETSTDFNVPYPANVTNLDIATVDASLMVVDRFWKIKNDSYSSKPSVNLIFTYDDANNEIGGSNMIIESDLKAQRHDGASWGNVAFGTADAVLNRVTATISSSNFYNIWILESSNIPLNINYSSIVSEVVDCQAKFTMKDFVSDGNDLVLIFKSTNGSDWQEIGEFSNCNSNECIFTDIRTTDGLSYYKFIEIDENGNSNELEIQSFTSNCENGLVVYPNPSNGIFNIKNCNNSIITVLDVFGRIVLTKNIHNDSDLIDLSAFSDGEYILHIIEQDKGMTAKKLIKN